MHWPNDQTAIRQRYAKDGFVILRQFLNNTQVVELQDNLQRYIDTVVPRVPPMDAFFEDAGTKQQIRMLPRMEQHDSYFHAILHHGCMPEVAAELCGSQVIAHDLAFFNKLPIVGDATPPHQDGFYFHLTPCRAITLWLALDEVDESNGCIIYVKGSHRNGMRPHARTEVLGFSQGITDYDASDRDGEVAACVSPGDLIVHDALTIHRAPPNHSPRPRRAIGFVYFSSAATVDDSARESYQQELASDWRQKGRI